MPKRKSTKTIDDVITFIQTTAPDNRFPLSGFSYELVDGAIQKLRAKGEFLDLEAYDIRGTKRMWNSEDGVNYALARTATKKLIKKLQEEQPTKTLEQILPEINQNAFYKKPINKYQTTLMGMLARIYQGSPYDALKDLIYDYEEFKAYRDLQTYDLTHPPLNTWNNKDGSKNYQLARTATKKLIKKLQEEQPTKTLEQILPEINQDTFKDKPINKYQTTLCGMLKSIYDYSPYVALKDLIDNDEEFKAYRDFQQYDMIQSPNNTWNKEDGIINYQLARTATKKLIKKLQEEQPTKTLEQILPKINQDTFYKKPINKYQTTLCGMLSVVYNNSPYAALKDLINNDEEFREYRDLQPYDMTQSPQNTWNDKNKTKNYRLARIATKTLIRKLKEELPEKIEQILPRINRETFCHKSINKYKTTLRGMLSIVYNNSSYKALKDLTQNDPEFKIYLPVIEKLKHF